MKGKQLCLHMNKYIVFYAITLITFSFLFFFMLPLLTLLPQLLSTPLSPPHSLPPSLPFSLPLLGLQFGVTELRFAQDVTRDMIADNKLVSCKY